MGRAPPRPSPLPALHRRARLRSEIELRKAEPAVVALRGIWEAVQAFQGGEQDDDVTIVVVRGMPV